MTDGGDETADGGMNIMDEHPSRPSSAGVGETGRNNHAITNEHQLFKHSIKLTILMSR